MAASDCKLTPLTIKDATPPVVVEKSIPEDAPLHGMFEWDDEQAARLQRESTDSKSSDGRGG